MEEVEYYEESSPDGEWLIRRVESDMKLKDDPQPERKHCYLWFASLASEDLWLCFGATSMPMPVTRFAILEPKLAEITKNIGDPWKVVDEQLSIGNDEGLFIKARESAVQEVRIVRPAVLAIGEDEAGNIVKERIEGTPEITYHDPRD